MEGIELAGGGPERILRGGGGQCEKPIWSDRSEQASGSAGQSREWPLRRPLRARAARKKGGGRRRRTTQIPDRRTIEANVGIGFILILSHPAAVETY